MTIDLRKEALSRSWLFRDLDADVLKDMAGGAVFRRFRQGEYIFREGDRPDFLYVLASGKAKQIKLAPSGRPFTVTINAPGDPLNISALFGLRHHFVSVQALTEANAVVVTRQAFFSFIERYPLVMGTILHALGMILNSAYERLSDLAGETASQRVLNVLYTLFFRFGKTMPFKRQEVAEIAGTTAETTVRVLSRLNAAGIIETRRGSIIVLDEAKLRDVCRSSYLIPFYDPGSGGDGP